MKADQAKLEQYIEATVGRLHLALGEGDITSKIPDLYSQVEGLQEEEDLHWIHQYLLASDANPRAQLRTEPSIVEGFEDGGTLYSLY